MQSKPKALVSWVFPEPGPTLIAEHLDAYVWPGTSPMSRAEFLQRLSGAEGVMVSNATERLDREALDAAPALRVISNFGVGVDNVDLPYAMQHGVMVCNTPGVLVDTTADHAFALLMATARRISEGERHVRADRWRGWSPTLLVGRDIYGATLGIIGLGNIGTAVARRAQGFAMKVLYASRTRKPDVEAELGITWSSLDGLLASADFVVLTTALTDETRGLIGEAQLRTMKPTGILINVARGQVVKTDDLYRALRDRVILAAGLDVTDPEPMHGNHPLLTLDNCVVVPHIASASAGARSQMAKLAATNLIDGLYGRRPQHLFNEAVWAHRKQPA
jgi:glyoxylate reductase